MKKVRFTVTHLPSHQVFPESIWHDQQEDSLDTGHWLVTTISELVNSGSSLTYKDSSGSLVFVPNDVLTQSVIQFESAEFPDPEIVH